jgi:hypothetical protein
MSILLEGQWVTPDPVFFPELDSEAWCVPITRWDDLGADPASVANDLAILRGEAPPVTKPDPKASDPMASEKHPPGSQTVTPEFDSIALATLHSLAAKFNQGEVSVSPVGLCDELQTSEQIRRVQDELEAAGVIRPALFPPCPVPHTYARGSLAAFPGFSADAISRLQRWNESNPEVRWIILPQAAWLARQLADKQKSDSLTELPAFDTETLAVLKALDEAHPRLLKNVEIEAATRLSKTTVGAAVRVLIDRGLAGRPEGERKGVAITLAGKEVLSRIP